MVDRGHLAIIGRKGGQVKSRAKTAASRLNGAKGGRPSTRTVAEALLRRPLGANQQKHIQAALENLLASERQVFTLRFGAPNDRAARPVPWEEFARMTGKSVVEARLVGTIALKKFRVVARLLLGKSVPDYRPKKDRRKRGATTTMTPREQERWERAHPGVPLPR